MPLYIPTEEDISKLQRIKEANDINRVDIYGYLVVKAIEKLITNYHFLRYEDSDLHSINNLVLDSVIRAHNKGNVPCNVITMDEVSIENVSSLLYFFMLSAAFSGYLFEIDPFNQPGVEVYKEEVRNSLNKG